MRSSIRDPHTLRERDRLSDLAYRIRRRSAGVRPGLRNEALRQLARIRRGLVDEATAQALLREIIPYSSDWGALEWMRPREGEAPRSGLAGVKVALRRYLSDLELDPLHDWTIARQTAQRLYAVKPHLPALATQARLMYAAGTKTQLGSLDVVRRAGRGGTLEDAFTSAALARRLAIARHWPGGRAPLAAYLPWDWHRLEQRGAVEVAAPAPPAAHCQTAHIIQRGASLTFKV